MAEDNQNMVSFKLSKFEFPSFKETKDGELVLYGKTANDLFPDKMIDLYERSTNHQAAVNTKHRLITGGGWTVDTTVMTKGEQAQYLELLRTINSSGDSLNDLTDKFEWDKLILGAFAIEVIYAKSGKKWVELNFVPVSMVRAVKTASGETKYCYLPNWKGVNKYDVAKTKEGFKEWSAFGSDSGAKSELFYYRDFRPIKNGESDVYAIPPYLAAIPWIELDAKTGVFHLNNLKNNFTAGTFINLFNGDPGQEQRDVIVKNFKETFTGENASETGGFVVGFNKVGSTAPTIERLSAGDQDKLYLQVADFARTGIFTAHGIPQSLMNVPTTGVVFERNTIMTDAEHFDATFVDPEQTILERAINHLMQYNGLKPLFRLQKVKPLGMQFSESIIKEFMPRDVMSKLVADSVGVNIKEIQQKLTFSTEPSMDEFFSFDMVLNEDGTPKGDEYYRSQHFAKVLDITLTDFDGDLLSLIQKNPTITPDAIAVGLKKSLDKVNESLSRLLENGALSGKIGDLKITKVAENTIKEEDIALDLQVRYFYEGPNDSRTRDWCKNMLELSKSRANGFTFEELMAQPESDALPSGMDNFNARGGFWTHKNGETTPYCRHKWVAKSVRIK